MSSRRSVKPNGPPAARRLLRILASVVALTAPQPVLLAAEATPPPGPAAFGEQVNVVEVQIPTNVVAGGQPVRGLTRESFRVFQGRQELPIVGFEVIDLATLEGSADGLVPLAARRHFLFLFDLVNSEPNGIERAREAALDFARRGLLPSDLAGVALFGRQGVELLLSFTSDRRQLELTLETFGASQSIERHQDPLMLSFVVVEKPVTDTSNAIRRGPGGPGGRTEDAQADREEEKKDSQRFGATAETNTNRRAHEDEATDLTRALAGLARLLATADGRKHAIFFSEGFEARLLTGDEELTAEARQKRESGEFWRAETEQDMGSGRLRGTLETMLEMFRRADVVIQSVDIGGLRATGRGAGEELLLAMARDTGGQLFSGHNDLREAMERLETTTAVTYLLSVEAPATPGDRAYRPLTVKLHRGPRGADVRHRQGYFPAALAGQEDPAATRLQSALRILGGEPGGDLQAAVRADVFPGSEGGALVPVIVEIDGADLAGGYQRGSVFAEIYAYAFAKDGALAGFFTKNVGLDLERVGRALATSGLAYVGQLELPPGEYSLRVLVRDPLRGATHLAVQSLVVPQGGQTAWIAGPWVIGQRAGWLLLAERDQAAGSRIAPHGAASLPTALPVVPADGETEVHLLAFGAPEAAGPLSARANALQVDTPGAHTGEISLELTADEVLPGGARRLAGHLRTAGLVPGTHALTVTVVAADGSTLARGTAAIEVR